MPLEREPSASITITWYLSYKYKNKKISETMFLLQNLNMELSGDCVYNCTAYGNTKTIYCVLGGQ
jgi:hypothetical protein